MQDVRDLVEQIRELGEDPDIIELMTLQDKLKAKLKEYYQPIFAYGNREEFLIESDKFSKEDTFLMEHRFEEVFIDEVADMIAEVDALVFSTDMLIDIFEYMVNNKIMSYKQDW